MINFSANFSNSIPTIHNLINIESNHMEIAFIGYSNSGKSSSINALTHQRYLAKVSQIPGSTKLINLFKIHPNIYFIDFPGYGYSNNTKKQKNYWYNMINQYLKKSKNLKGLIITTDIRHAIKNLDQKTIEYALTLHIPSIILLNKSDKISKNTACKILYNIKKEIIHNKTTYDYININTFSAIKLQGVTSTIQILKHWLS